MTNEQFEKQVRQILDSHIKNGRKTGDYVKRLKKEYPNRINHIIKILKDYE